MEDYLQITNFVLQIFVNIITIITVVGGWKIHKLKVQNKLLDYYQKIYNNVQKILDKYPTGNVSLDDINNLGIEEQNATVYLDSKTVELIRDIRNIAVELHVFYETNEKNRERHQSLLSKWSYYKAHLSEYYRKQIVSEPLGWLNNKKKGQ